MPVRYMMQGLFAAPFNSEETSGRNSTWKNVVGFVFPSLSRPRHQEMMGKINSDGVRLIFSQLTWPDGKYAPANEALNFSVKHLPLIKVDVDLKNRSVVDVEKTLNRNLWGRMPMPAF